MIERIYGYTVSLNCGTFALVVSAFKLPLNPVNRLTNK